jgi:dihydroorotate dehydrogenase
VLFKILFLFYPETAHHMALRLLQWRGKFYRSPSPAKVENVIEIAGLAFPNRVGLAAGFDKEGRAIDGLATLGFGHIEIGTITPRPQAGNPQKRLFRLTAHQAIINRMGFNNVGVDQTIRNIKAARYRGILGINIGKNADTPLEKAVEDYLYCLKNFYPYASYITINISSPNTAHLRTLQHGEQLRSLLQALKKSQTELALQHNKKVPLFVKIAPDLSSQELQDIAKIMLEEKIEGVIATNTTQSREGVLDDPQSAEAGGLSGAPLSAKSTELIRQLAGFLEGHIPIIASGGVMTAQDALEKIQAGASLVQIYTGFIYHGPALVQKINRALVSQSRLSF